MASSNGMTFDEMAELAAALCATAEAMGHSLTADAAEMMVEDLAEYPVRVVRDALRACRRELAGRLTLAAILQRVQQADGHAEPNEAWSIALQAFDEHCAVVLTPEIERALGVARPLLAMRDKVGAGMAFREAYGRELTQARRTGRAAGWHLSLGMDPATLAPAIEEAQRLGRLSPREVSNYVALLVLEPVNADGQAIAGLVTGKGDEQASPRVRERLRVLREDMARHAAEQKAVREAARAAERAELARRKAAAAEAVEREIAKRQGGGQ